MFTLTLSLLAANLAEVKVIPVEASARQRLRFDRAVSCVTLAPTP